MADAKIVITTKEVPQTFIKKKHDLKELQRRLKEVSESAISTLVDVMKDTTVDPKVRADAAGKLLGFQLDTDAQISKDSLNRLIAEIKLAPGGGARQLTTEDAEREDNLLPSVDFTNIREIG